MADPFVAEIRIVGFNFAPKGWAFCDGQLIPISQNTALFSLLGTMYGGDGKSTFALPDLQGRAAMMHGQGPGLSLYDQGQTGGSEFVTLIESEMPAHSHTMQATAFPATTGLVANGHALARGVGGLPYDGPATSPSTTPMAFQTLAIAGGSLPHNNMMPYLTMNYIIALQGVFPPRT